MKIYCAPNDQNQTIFTLSLIVFLLFCCIHKTRTWTIIMVQCDEYVVTSRRYKWYALYYYVIMWSLSLALHFFSWLNELHSNALKNRILKSQCWRRAGMGLQLYSCFIQYHGTFSTYVSSRRQPRSYLKTLIHSITMKRFRNLRHFAV